MAGLPWPWNSSRARGTKEGQKEAKQTVEEAAELARRAAFMATVAAVAAIVVPQAVAAIHTVVPNLPVIKDIIDAGNKAVQKGKALKKKVDGYIDKVKGALHVAKIQTAIHFLKTANTVLSVVSPAYRDWIVAQYDRVGEISKQVFGKTETVLGAMQLYRLAVYDTTRLTGQPIDVAENSWFSGVHKVVENIEANARKYQRNPGEFFAYLDSEYLTPQYVAQSEAQKANNETMAAIRDIASGADLVAVGVGERFDAYREALNPFLSIEQAKDLDTMRRDYRLKVLRPLDEFSTFMEETYPEALDQLDEIDQDLLDQKGEIGVMSEITADPNNLDLATRLAQRKRFRQILESAWTIEPESSALANDAQRRLEEVLTGSR